MIQQDYVSVLIEKPVNCLIEQFFMSKSVLLLLNYLGRRFDVPRLTRVHEENFPSPDSSHDYSVVFQSPRRDQRNCITTGREIIEEYVWPLISLASISNKLISSDQGQ